MSMSIARTLSREQLQWRVYEVSTLAVPGALASCCLIFDSDAVVRRAWRYPANWTTLGDDELWALIAAAPQPDFANAVDSQMTPVDSAAQMATEMISTARSLTSESRVLREANRALRDQRDELLRSCRASRDVMLAAVGRYAAGLKESGATPELAIVLVKDAIRDGLGGAAQVEEPDGASVMGAGVAHAIKSFYAA